MDNTYIISIVEYSTMKWVNLFSLPTHTSSWKAYMCCLKAFHQPSLIKLYLCANHPAAPYRGSVVPLWQCMLVLEQFAFMYETNVDHFMWCHVNYIHDHEVLSSFSNSKIERVWFGWRSTNLKLTLSQRLTICYNVDTPKLNHSS